MITYIKLVQKGKNILKIGQKSQACVTHWAGKLLESHSECVRNGRCDSTSTGSIFFKQYFHKSCKPYQPTNQSLFVITYQILDLIGLYIAQLSI